MEIIDHTYDEIYKQMAAFTKEAAAFEQQVTTLKILIAEKIDFLLKMGQDQKTIANTLRKFMKETKEEQPCQAA
jgi:hypothetical protein